jgi:hypothetical protein
LKSIDANPADIEVVICEDLSPMRKQIKLLFDLFMQTADLNCKLYLNEVNLGYDENLKELIKRSNGTYIMYMGDDDIFQAGQLQRYIDFLKAHTNLGYILRRYSVVHKDGEIERFRYFDTHTFFKAGPDAFKALFRKSVFISGFCFKRKWVLPYFDTSEFKGTLLYQLFLCGRLVLEHESAYCDIPITIMDENERGIPEFGNSQNEAAIYTPGTITVQNSVNFMKSFLRVTAYFDKQFNFNASKMFLIDLSKYSYPVLSIQRGRGVKVFREYNKQLRSEVGINQTVHYYIYYYALLILGKKVCDSGISFIKRILGKTPRI